MQPIKELEDCALKVLKEFAPPTNKAIDDYADKIERLNTDLENGKVTTVTIVNGEFAGMKGTFSDVSDTNPESSVIITLDDTGEEVSVDVNDIEIDDDNIDDEDTDFDSLDQSDRDFGSSDESVETGIEDIPGTFESGRFGGDDSGNKEATIKPDSDLSKLDIKKVDDLEESKKEEIKPHRSFRIKKKTDDCCQKEKENERKLIEAREFGFSK